MVVGDFAQGAQVAVIGGGPGGYVAAIRAAQLGFEVVLIEREHVGGVCLNTGCIPSKALIHVAGLKAQIEHAESLGLVDGSVRVDMPRLMGWKNGVVEKLRKGIASLLSQYKIEVVRGNARLSGDRTFVVESDETRRRFECENLIVATGSSPVELPMLRHDGKKILDSTDALDLRDVPPRLLVIGAGAVGLELGMVYARLGSKVTIIDAVERLLPAIDPQIGRVMEAAVKRLNIELALGAKVSGGEIGQGPVLVRYAANGQDKTVEADKVLVAVGRRPNTKGIGLESAGLNLDERGFVPVDAQMKTNVKGIFAIGDVVSGPMLAHRASYQGKVAAEVIAKQPAAYDGVEVPNVIFSDPEIATVGLTESAAREKGIEPKSGVFPFRALGRALTMNDEGNGFTKVVSDAKTGTVLGVHIVGPHASDLISEGCLAVSSASHIDDLSLTMHPHPTLPEGILEAAEQIEHHAIHIFNPPQKTPKNA